MNAANDPESPLSPSTKRARRWFALPLVALLLFSGTTAFAQLSETQRVEVAERLQASTVAVHVGRGGGSGFVATEDGWVVTNAHVVAAGRGVMLEYSDGQRRQGRVLVVDRQRDLALIEPTAAVTAPPLPLGDADQVRVGQSVMAFGSPFGLDGTLTQGIVSARRTLPSIAAVEGLIQTDATINPGNSGGPLVNGEGHVVGVNTAIFSRTGGSHGIGFAVPVNYVQQLVASAQERRASDPATRPNRALAEQPRRQRGMAERRSQSQGLAQRHAVPEAGTRPSSGPQAPGVPSAASTPWLGVVGEEVRGRRVSGVRIRQVMPGSPAAQAGLRGLEQGAPGMIQRLGVQWTGHIIVSADGQPVRNWDELLQVLAARRPGDETKLGLVVGDGRLRGQVTVRLGERPEAPPAP